MRVYLRNRNGKSIWSLIVGEMKDVRRECELRSIKIGVGAIIGDGAKIGDGAIIGDEAEIGDWASIGDGAEIGNGAIIGNEAEIGNGAVFDKSPLYIVGTKYIVNQYSGDELKIGCEVRTISEWLNSYESIARNHGDGELVDEYKLYIDLAKQRMCGKEEGK